MADELLSRLRKLDVKIWAAGERLRYDAPKGVLTAGLRAELAERKAEILALLREATATTHCSPAPIEPISRSENLPLSFAQQRLWFLQQLEPGDTSYNMHQAIRINGALRVGALQQALNVIVVRHEALRTTFTVVDGSPVQIIAPASASVALPIEELSGLPQAGREAEARRQAREEAQRPFDLGQEPLFRVKLLRLGKEEHVLLLTIHHIVSDGWSMGVLWRELGILYEAFVAGEPSPLPELPIQYADFTAWQRQWLQGEVLKKQISYWKRQFAGAPALLELPTDRPRPPVRTFRGARQSLLLPQSLAKALKELSRREGATLFMTLLAAFQVLLSRYTGRDDVVVGTPIANRHRPETEGLIGLFANTLALRADLSGDPTFREFLGRVREVALGAYEHQDLPFEKLVEELKPERDLSRTPLFQVLFGLQNVPRQALKLPGLTLSRLEVKSGTAQFDLSLYMFEGPEGLKGSFGYNTDLFEAATIGRMVGHFRTLLEGIVTNPGRRLSALPLLTDGEHRQLLVEWNDTQGNYSGENLCVHEVFEAQAARTPDAVAVTFEGRQLTYAELNARANQLAHHLRKLGVGPEVPVGICVERSLEMVVGMLGILKAGGAYLPLDPAYPKQRLAWMLQDARLGVLLTQARLRGRLPASQAQVVCLDAGEESIARQSEENPASTATAENLAYTIYTSGSTGWPKGVQVSHRNVVNLFEAARPSLGLSEHDVWTVVHSYAFDFSTWELWGALLHGARLVVVPRWVTQSPAELYSLLEKERVTVLNQTPSAVRQLARVKQREKKRVAGAPGDLSLRVLICGGEALPTRLASQLLKWDIPVWNFYGPTETTVWSATHRVSSSTGPVPLGRPLANTRVYILDPHLQPVPIGVPGELHLGGLGLTRGYLNRPELTAEKFVPDPFSYEPGARLYKTGDLARYLPDGNIEYLGRIDHQVKVRGYRIEPEEVEAVLGQHPDLRETVVTAREEEPGEQRLVAYVVPEQGQVPQTSELRRYLKARLPEYMVPSAFAVVEMLPLTPNGKVDRRGLPAPAESSESESAFVAPRGPIEEELVGVWAEVLGVGRVGVNDDFFELGGHSLLAARLASVLSVTLDVDIPVKLLVTHPTIAALAKAIEQLRRAGEGLSTTRALPSTAAPPSPLARPNDDSASHTSRFVRQPLLSLFAAGRLPPVDAAALTYLADDLPARTGRSREEIRALWLDNLPTVTAVLETFLGRIAIITLPRFARELYEDQDDMVGGVVEALATAGGLGARAVSLTGLVPSATDYGHAIATRIGQRELPAITTGHATTAATVVLTTERLLEAAGRGLADAHLGVLGWGPIGRASLRLLLRVLPHPAAITVCDVYGIEDRADDIRRELAEEVGYRGPVRVVGSRGEAPAEFYESTVMLGATNVANVLKISRVQPGTIIVDYSNPHCFSVPAAVRRLGEAEDILFTEGGFLRAPRPIERVRYLPRDAEQTASASYLKRAAKHDPRRIAGCILAGLLCAHFPDLSPTVGHVDDDSCAKHYERLRQLGFLAADPHCEEHALAPEAIRGFRERFGELKLSLPSAPTRVHDRV